MRPKTAVVSVSICLVVVAASAFVTRAGPLDPPNGPVTPTMRTLDQVEPRIPLSAETTPGDADSKFRITLPGSYYLTGNLTTSDGSNGIEINASGVTVDLGGFELIGFVFQGTSKNGVLVTQTGARNITIRNGSVRNWGASGIDTGDARGVRISDVVSTANGGTGFALVGGATVTDCMAYENGQVGFSFGIASVLDGCVARDNGSAGFDGARSVLTRCVARSNDGDGFHLFGCTVSDCHAEVNAGDGIEATGSSSLDHCVSNSNGSQGFYIKQTAARACAASSNTEDGYLVDSACTVVSCSARSNGTGIRVVNPGSRIESNTVSDSAGIGIDVNGSSNIVIGNTARGNSGGNFSIGAGNHYGQILTSPGSAFVSSNAWANFAY